MIDSVRLKDFLQNNPKEVSINYSDLSFPDTSDFQDFQAGYRFNSITSEDLTSDKSGSWQKDWYVIGYHSGDPFFVKLSSDKVPVYTAYHGQGNWEPKLVTKTIEDFQQIINKIKEISIGRETPISFEKNPITEREIKDLRKVTRRVGSDYPWMVLLE